ncbi:MAG: glycosyltransferase family 4 protein [Planctomycetota bacterium]|jgi:UDP-glucose:(heptosyl)LPS alpha-1,3-glucosyltransferase
MEKRIAIIIERANIALGGAERSAFELATALSALGHKVDILAAKGQINAKDIHVLCRNTPGKRACYLGFAKALRKHLAENQYDIIHSLLPFDFADIYQPRGGTFAESILRNAAGYQNKFVASYKRITAFANFRRTVLLQAERRLCRNPEGPVIAALSEYVAKQFKEHYGTADERIVIISNGIRVNKPINQNEAEKLRGQILVQLGLKEADKPVFFLFAANNFRLKGLATLIRAMHTAARQNAGQCGFLIVAGNSRPYKYRTLAGKLGVNNRIIFLGAVRRIQNVLSIADVAVLPTFYDPASRFILEAIGAGRPVITTNFNGATDLFVRDRHGKVIDSPDNISALAEAISYFTNRDNIQKSAEAIIEDNLTARISISRVAGEMDSLYNQIIERRGEQ